MSFDLNPSTSPPKSKNPYSQNSTEYQTKPDDLRPPPRPATTATAATTISGAFFAGAHNFHIHGGEFSHTAGNVHKTIRSDYSTRSNFDNSYGNDFSRSGNLAHNHSGGYNDNRQYQSQRYDVDFKNSTFVSDGRGRGQRPVSPHQYEHRSNYIHEPYPQQGYPYQQQPALDERPITAPSMLESSQALDQHEFDQHAFDRAYNIHREPEENLSHDSMRNSGKFRTTSTQSPSPNSAQEASSRVQDDIVMDGGNDTEGEGGGDLTSERDVHRSNTAPIS
ncbi:hypothetical protein F5876DRAFT_77939 [Lentinula aff. lateritia]|uniref:Uncharacterized protein n=1 Tax=Lentinula aff. lateritia TaxID=2804960 RepID=A0ACC1TX28_9AGAR|nr:hypothetical protein F5876DRAFT_77939 [Lentinula aff. lateritia]